MGELSLMANFILNRLRHLSGLERLVIAAVLVCFLTLFWRLSEGWTAGWAVKDAAVAFAQSLRGVQALAHERNCILEVTVLPPTARRRFSYVARDGDQIVLQKEFLGEVVVAGRCSFDPHGVPIEPASFVFSKGKFSERVNIDVKGMVTVARE